MGKKYLDTKVGTLESSILGVWQEAAKKNEDKLDPVNKKAVKKDFDDRKDKDIDNDGDVDSTDKYLHKRRKAVSKAIANEELDEGKMKDLSMKVDAVVAKMKKDRQMKGFADKFKKDVMKSMSIEKSLEKVLPDYIAGKEIQKLVKEGLEDKTDNPANSQHMCAKNVVHEEWGAGQPVHGQHADPDENGEIAWYDVMFEHGIEMGVSINELKVTKEAMHNSHNKDHDKDDDSRKVLKAKKDKEVKESYEIGTDEYLKHTVDVTPGENGEWATARDFKVASMKEALAKVWGLDEKRLDKTEEDDKIAPVKGKKTMTGGDVAKVQVDPEKKEK